MLYFTWNQKYLASTVATFRDKPTPSNIWMVSLALFRHRRQIILALFIPLNSRKSQKLLKTQLKWKTLPHGS